MSPFRKKIDSMRADTALPAPDKSLDSEKEAETMGAEEGLEQVVSETDALLEKAESAGALTVLEPFVKQVGCSDTKELLKRAQTVDELKGKPPAEVASMLGADSGLVEKLKGGYKDKSEPPMEKQEEPMGGSPKERFGAKIKAMRSSAEE
jgi:hypothetical protein